ncbi:MAG: DinB family protein [Acidimicrobiales bacterium]
MADKKPPRLEGDEQETLQALLQYQRESLVREVVGVGEDDARRALVPSGTTLLWLIKHMAQAELLWIVHRFAAEPVELSDGSLAMGDTVAGCVAAYRQAWERVDDGVAGAAGLEAPCRLVGDEAPVNSRWVLMHLLEETARRAGHADILRELVDGETGR